MRFGSEFIIYSFKYKDKMRGCRPRAGWRRTCSRDVVMAARLGQINATLHISLLVPPVVIVARAPGPSGRSPSAHCRCALGLRRRREEEAQRVYGWRGGAASLRRADAAKVCSNVGLVLFDGVFECSVAVAATQGVRGRLRARQGLRHPLSLAATSAFDATSTRHISRWPFLADHIRGVTPLTKNKLTYTASVHEITLRGKLPIVSGVDVGRVFQQKAAYVRVTIMGRIHQGGVLTKKTN
jgi:hypothetical protein